ncbi:hypothetical protein EO244_00300 [Ancylomarina salipaludis]|uniref:Helix-hairpin-helix domain-containing protein n=1 Tax=Ancylomarina salipaludis TaxID=2501299 RepID=A0A4V1N0I2_9BACT|nr:helix-hairpin-helix domain-containing protein [Ancylomarina salipaludis]RXQ97367.1 hypothetical protein EO244_00300 [Ancylomarina salipaludis]
MSFKKSLKSFFSYSASERKSLMVLIAILLFLFLYPVFIPDKVDGWNQSSEKQKRLDSLLVLLEKKSKKKQEIFKTQNLFFFDPNAIDSSQLVSLGFTKFQISNLINYRKKGGEIKTCDDLMKIYGITDGLYKRLQPYIRIKKKQQIRPAISKVKLRLFDPNTVCYDDLLSFGLTKFQAQNILNYRKKSGVFKQKNDFLKIYGIDSTDYNRLEKFIHISPTKKSENQLFVFDPNTISEADWDRLGVQSYIVTRISKYLTKGGRFKKSEDLMAIYGFDSLKYKELLPFIRIETMKEAQIVKLDLNSADTNQLVVLPGIGSYFAKKIIDYRSKLGGFYNIYQLADIYGLRKSRVDSLSSYLLSDLEIQRFININTATVEELNAHPYISFREASDIIRLRKRKGEILDMESLCKQKILRQSVYERVKPYLILK